MRFTKKLLAMTLVIMLALASIPITVSANDAITVTIDGMTVDFEDQMPIMISGRVLIPVRFVFHDLGFEPGWVRETRTATLTRYDFEIVLIIGSYEFTVNDEVHELDVPAQLIGGRTMVPMGPILRSIGIEPIWSGTARSVTIVTSDTVEEDEPYDEDDASDEGLYRVAEFGDLSVIVWNREGDPIVSAGYFYWDDNFGFDTPLVADMFLATPFEEGSINGLVEPFESVRSFNVNVAEWPSIGVFMQGDDGGWIGPDGNNIDFMGVAFYLLLPTSEVLRLTSTPFMPQPPELIVLNPSGGFIVTSDFFIGSLASVSWSGHQVLFVVYVDDEPGIAVAHFIFD